LEATVAINYELMKVQGPKLKAELTRAVNSGNYDKVLNACTHAVKVWEVAGAWPDNWNTWQRALYDAAAKHNHTGPREYVIAPRLEELI
jgi:hypothetical protein